jgi:hypothetical protein
MTFAWKAFVSIGVVLICVALGMDTTAEAGIGRVHNIGLQARQQMIMILGCVLFLAGIVLFATSQLKQTQKQKQEAQDGRKREDVSSVLGTKPEVDGERIGGLSVQECIENLVRRGYKVTPWFGWIWTVRTPDGKSVELASSVVDLRRLLSEIES